MESARGAGRRRDAGHVSLFIGGIAIAIGGAALFGLVAHTWTPYLPQKGAGASPRDSIPLGPPPDISRLADISQSTPKRTRVAPVPLPVPELLPVLAETKLPELAPYEPVFRHLAYDTVESLTPDESVVLAPPPAAPQIARAMPHAAALKVVVAKAVIPAPPVVPAKVAETKRPLKTVAFRYVETKPVETKPVEAKRVPQPTPQKAVEEKRVDARRLANAKRMADAKAAEARRAAEAKAAEARAAEARRVAEAKAAEARRVAEAKAAEARRVAEAKAAEAKAAEARRVAAAKAAEEKVAEAKAAAKRLGEMKVAEARLAERERAAQLREVEAKLAETQLALETKAAEAKLAEARRVAETRAAEAKFADIKPAVETRVVTSSRAASAPRYSCDDCGKVTSVVARLSDRGKYSWEVRVHFPGGDDRVFNYPTDPGLLSGDSVRYQAGRLTPVYLRQASTL